MKQVNNNTIITSTTQYAELLKAGKSYGEAMQDIAKQLNGTPCPKLIESLANTHATYYKCTTKLGNRGGFVFEINGERLDSATKSWQRNVAVWFKKDAKPTVSKQVDQVAVLLKKFESLTPAQKKRFLSAV